MENKNLTGYPSIDKPWLKYYDEKAINSPLPKCSMYEYLYQCNKDYLDNTALNYFGKKITYKKLFENIDKVAVCLQAAGVKKGDIISVCTLTAPESVYLLYAINKVGAVSNWLGLTSPVQDLHEQLASTGSKLVFAVEMAYDLIVEAAKETKVEKIVSIPIEYSMPTAIKAAASLKQKRPKLNDMSIKWKEFLTLGEGKAFEAVEIDCKSMAIIEYTGGTTGVPKGVMLSAFAMNSYHNNFGTTNANGWTCYERGDSFLCCIPLFLAIGLSSCLHGPLTQGLECVLSPDPGPEAVVKVILKNKPNHIICAPIHYNHFIEILEKEKADLSFVKSAMYGGESIDIAWETRINSILNQHSMDCPVLNGYGMTETAAAILIVTRKLINGLLPLAGVNIKIIDEEMNECRYNEKGELCLSSNTIMNGYFNNEAENGKVFFESDGTKWLRTSDLAVITDEGLVRITGRIKRIFWKKGINETINRIYPLRIEDVIEENKKAINCSVVGIKNEITGYKTIAFVIPKGGTDTSALEKELDKLCRENLPESHVPDEYRFVSEFPLTRAGKVDYRALEKMAEEPIDNA